MQPARLLCPWNFLGKNTWSGLPFSSPGDLPNPGTEPKSLESTALAVLCLDAQLCLTLCNPMDCSPPGSSVPGDSPGKNTGVGCHASSRGSFNPGIKPRSPALQVNSSLPEPPGKPKNTRVGSLSLPQGIFQAQEWNRGLLHCRWILHQLTYQGSPELGADMFFLIRVSPAK